PGQGRVAAPGLGPELALPARHAAPVVQLRRVVHQPLGPGTVGVSLGPDLRGEPQQQLFGIEPLAPQLGGTGPQPRQGLPACGGRRLRGGRSALAVAAGRSPCTPSRRCSRPARARTRGRGKTIRGHRPSGPAGNGSLLWRWASTRPMAWWTGAAATGNAWTRVAVRLP